MKLAELYTELTTKSSAFFSDMNKAQEVAKHTEDSLRAVSDTARNIFVASSIAAGGFLKVASDIEESESKFNAVFKSESDAAREFANVLAGEVNRSAYAVREAMSRFQDTFVPLGFTREKAAELSEQLVTLGIDVASFNNELEPETMASFQSALIGNHETVRKFGIIITEVTLNQELMRMGIEGGTRKATEQQKVLARLNIIMSGTTDAQGDAARTAGGLENQFKGLTANAQDVANALGKSLMPAATAVIASLNGYLIPISRFITDNQQAAAETMKLVLGISGLTFALTGGSIVLAKTLESFYKLSQVFKLLPSQIGSTATAFGKFGVAVATWFAGYEVGLILADLLQVESKFKNVFNMIDSRTKEMSRMQIASAIVDTQEEKQGYNFSDEERRAKIREIFAAEDERFEKQRREYQAEEDERYANMTIEKELADKKQAEEEKAKLSEMTSKRNIAITEAEEKYKQRALEISLDAQQMSISDFYEAMKISQQKTYEAHMAEIEAERGVAQLLTDEEKKKTELYSLETEQLLLQIQNKQELADLESKITKEYEKQKQFDLAKEHKKRVEYAKQEVDLARESMEQVDAEVTKLQEQLQLKQQEASEKAGRFTSITDVSRNIQVGVAANQEKSQIEVLKEQITEVKGVKDILKQVLTAAQEQVNILQEKQDSVVGVI